MKSNEFIFKTLFKVGMVFVIAAWIVDWWIYLVSCYE